MDGPLDEQYLKWLYRQVASSKYRNPARTYWSLLRQLYTTEFVWTVPNDDNRVEDGRDLRYEFFEEVGLRPDSEWMSLNCSMLEMMIGLSRRLSFESEDEPIFWFWEMIENLGLQDYSDLHHHGNTSTQYIAYVLDQVITRNYEPNGQGGLFPLNNTERDQRTVEIWYQIQEYLLERD